jgi:NADPH:quinone reductase-like Zn-dependent oxidoreductase
MSGPVIATGPARGVGSVAAAILSNRGFQVTASGGRLAEADDVKKIGRERARRAQRARRTRKPLAKVRWAGGIDGVGSTTLANVLSMTRYGERVAWRAAWNCRLRSRHLFCTGLRCSALIRLSVRLPIGNRGGGGWRV